MIPRCFFLFHKFSNNNCFKDHKANEFYYFADAISRATCTPLADAWESEWVMPLPSPMIYRPG